MWGRLDVEVGVNKKKRRANEEQEGRDLMDKRGLHKAG